MNSYLDYLKTHPADIEPGQNVTIIPFQPRYAEAFSRCYYEIYQDTFPVDYVYEPQEVIDAVAAGDLLPVLAVTPRGEVVGLGSAFHFGPNRKAWEIGGVMTLPAYRKENLARPLIKQLDAELAALEPDSIYGTAVCNHIYTQYMQRAIGSVPTALDLDSFINYENDQAITTSLLFAFHVFNQTPATLYLPDYYHALADEIYAGLKLERHLLDSETQPERRQSEFTVASLPPALRLTLSEVGQDVVDVVTQAAIEHPDCHAIQVCLPLWQRSAPWACRQLRDAGFFLSGILPLWADSDMLALQRTNRELDVAALKLCTKPAKRLMQHVFRDRGLC
ncbi:MAG: GNAT family N-acetyltransferase [Pseudomonadota bacterium]